ncbi:MAG: RNA polymerase sigma factor [Lysinibacillus sp.]
MDNQAFQNMYLSHSDAIFKYIYYLQGNKEQAEDFTQETFTKAYQNYKSYRQEANELTWLRQIARHLVYDHYRRQKIVQFLPFVQKEQMPDEAILPEEFLLKGEEFSYLFRELYKLKLEYREAIIARYIEELSVKEAAHMLGWNEAKVKNNTARALKSLQKGFGEEGYVNG